MVLRGCVRNALQNDIPERGEIIIELIAIEGGRNRVMLGRVAKLADPANRRAG